MIQPIGKLRCMDVATCGRECFYCDWCKSTRKLKLLEVDQQQLLAVLSTTSEHGWQPVQGHRRAHLPADDASLPASRRSQLRHVLGVLEERLAEGLLAEAGRRRCLDEVLRAWTASSRGERAEKLDQHHVQFQLEREFFAQVDNPLLGKAFKLAIIGEWLGANSLDVRLTC